MPKQSKTKILTILLFFISPFLALIPILVEMKNNKRYAYFLFMIFMGMVAYLYPPAGDLYRYYQFYDICKNIPLSEIFNMYIFDFTWYILLWIMAKLSIPFGFCQFIIAITSSSILYYIFKQKGIFTIKRRYSFILFISFFFMVAFWSLISGRFGLGLYFYLLSIYFYKENRKRLFYIWSIIAILTHLSFLFILLIFIICISFKNFINKYTLLAISFIIISGSYIIGIYLEGMGFDKAVYITESHDWLSEASFLLQFFYRYLCKLTFWILLIFIIQTKETTDSIYKFSLLLIVTSISCYKYPDLSSRIITVSTTISALYLFIYNQKTIKYKKWCKYFLISSMIVFLASSATTYKNIQTMNWNILFKPIPFIMKHEYSYNWIEKNYSDGERI